MDAEFFMEDRALLKSSKRLRTLINAG